MYRNWSCDANIFIGEITVMISKALQVEKKEKDTHFIVHKLVMSLELVIDNDHFRFDKAKPSTIFREICAFMFQY